MPGKSKDSKANKGRKALQSEWEDAVNAAEAGESLIASAVNIVKKGSQSGPTGVYVAQTAGGNAKDRLRKYEEALAQADRERESKVSDDLAAMSIKNNTVEGGKELSEKEILKAKKKKEKEDQKAFEKRAEEEKVIRAKEKEEKMLMKGL